MDDINAGYERLAELQVTVIFEVVTMTIFLCDATSFLDKHSGKPTVRSPVLG